MVGGKKKDVPEVFPFLVFLKTLIAVVVFAAPVYIPLAISHVHMLNPSTQTQCFLRFPQASVKSSGFLI